MSELPLEPPATVEVWRFRRYDNRSGGYVTSIGKATIDAIERFGAETVPGSMESVPQHRLDGNGIYTPRRAAMSIAARRRLERLRAEYAVLCEEEDHERLIGWSERFDALSSIVKQIDQTLAALDTD